MGIIKFFKKATGWVKDKFHKAKNVIGKFVSPVAKVAKKVISFVDKTPIGGILSKLTGGIYDTAKKVIGYLPDGTVKDNASKFADKAKETAGSAIGRVERIQEKAKEWIDRGRKINGTIVHGLRNNLGNGGANNTTNM